MWRKTEHKFLTYHVNPLAENIVLDEVPSEDDL